MLSGPHVGVTVVDAAELRPPVPGQVTVTVAILTGPEPVDALAHADVVLSERRLPGRQTVTVPDVDAAVSAIQRSVAHAPRAAATLVVLLRQTEILPVRLGIAAESAAYSMLLAGPEFAQWRVGRVARPVPPTADAVLIERAGNRVTIRLNRPERRNAYGVAVRDGLNEALELVLADDSITAVDLRGNGAVFCSGGDLDEFGTTPDVATAHLIRLDRSAAVRLAACCDRVTVHVHGACVGAGIEIPSFADRIVARADAWFRLPELGMGLVPGAGGTVGLTRRIGRHRTAYLALSGARLDVADAQAWGLVDDVQD